MTNQTSTSPPELTIRDVAALMGYSAQTIRNLTNLPEDPLPSFRLPGRLAQRRFRKSDVEAWVARRMKGGSHV